MPIVNITSLVQPGVEVYGNLTEKQLRHQYEHGNGIFIVESPKVITRALDAGYQPLSLLCEERHVEGDAAEIIARCPDIPVYGQPRVACHAHGLCAYEGCAVRYAPSCTTLC